MGCLKCHRVDDDQSDIALTLELLTVARDIRHAELDRRDIAPALARRVHLNLLAIDAVDEASCGRFGTEYRPAKPELLYLDLEIQENERLGQNKDAQILLSGMKRLCEQGGACPAVADLVPVLNASGSVAPTWACRALAIILEHHDDPAAFAGEVFKHATAPARGWMMRFCTRRIEVARALASAGIVDRSSRVREWACEAVERVRFVELEPALHRMAISDAHSGVRERASSVRSIMAREFHLTLDDDGKTCLFWMRTLSGARSLVGLDRTLVEQLGLHEAAYQIRFHGLGTNELGL